MSELSGTTLYKPIRFNWEFRIATFNEDRLSKDFKEEIRRLIDKFSGDYYRLLSDGNAIQQLKRIYEKNFSGNINDTSLMVRSHPLSKAYTVDTNMLCTECWYELRYGRQIGTSDTLLTGDLTIDHHLFDRHHRELRGLASHFPRVLQVPHHGARQKRYCNFCHDICHEMIKMNFRPYSLVVSYGIRNIYGHPSFECIRCHPDYENLWCANLVLVNERNEFNYTVVFE